MYLLYLSFVKLYAGFIGIASLFHGKAKQWVKGRKNWEKKLKQHKKNLNKVYWFHCASLGEFDQAVPIMEKLKEKDPSIDIVVSFFSPSGYEIKKSYGLASYTCYLPIDSPSNAKKFLEILQPQKAFFIKYEVWPFYFKALEKQNIPLYLVSATFRSNQIYFKWYGKWFLKLLHIPKGIFVQNDASKEVLNKHGVSSTVTGDTRYDKVKQNADRKKANEIVQNFKKNDHVLILGSSWDPEETLIAKAFDESYKLIIAPHDVSKGNISRLNTLFPSAINYTNISIDDTLDSKILIVDCIGVLSNIYQYGDTVI